MTQEVTETSMFEYPAAHIEWTSQLSPTIPCLSVWCITRRKQPLIDACSRSLEIATG